ncbi:MAG TPA: ferritin family protein [Burkholderiales bacterium]|nr:ferritin family protein [Burkholderiales bacterium]
MKIIDSLPQLYAHAIAMEREAAARYGEFAERMEDQGREDLARVFGLLARMEAEHLEALERRTAGIALPAIAAQQYAWLDAGGPETAARELVFRLMTPRHALAIALAAERRAQGFFEQVYWTTSDPALRALAREMAAEERGHVELVSRMLNDAVEPTLDQTVIFSH